MRIIFVPQYPTPMRYSEWWIWKLPEEFKKAGHEVIVLGKDYAKMMEHRRGGLDMFSPINMAIELETEQIREYMMLDLTDDDVLFLADLSFSGFFCNALFHKQPKKKFAFCHATSLNKFDYFEGVFKTKFPVEAAHAQMFDKIFVGSRYHAQKLLWYNTEITYLPFPPFKPSVIQDKTYKIMSASRPTTQKVNEYLEKEISKIFGPIHRPISRTWKEYFDNLASSQILLVTAFEDTFGYQIVDAVMNGCIPLARNGLAYVELLPGEYLYNDKDELLIKIHKVLNDELPVPKLLCEEQMKNFYRKIIEEMEQG